MSLKEKDRRNKDFMRVSDPEREKIYKELKVNGFRMHMLSGLGKKRERESNGEG